MRKTPDISIIIPVYNQEKYIGRCIRSALNQKYPEDKYEIIVIDDGSSDRTKYALKLFEDEIRVVDNGKQIGLPSALNAGIQSALGQYVIRLDSDDYVHREYINVLSMHLKMNKQIDAIACDYKIVNDEEEVVKICNCLDHPIGCGIMFRIDDLVELGLYDEDMLSHEDKDLMIRFLGQHSLHRVALPLYRYRQHDTNMTNDTKAMQSHMSQLEEKHGSELVKQFLERYPSS